MFLVSFNMFKVNNIKMRKWKWLSTLLPSILCQQKRQLLRCFNTFILLYFSSDLVTPPSSNKSDMLLLGFSVYRYKTSLLHLSVDCFSVNMSISCLYSSSKRLRSRPSLVQYHVRWQQEQFCDWQPYRRCPISEAQATQSCWSAVRFEHQCLWWTACKPGSAVGGHTRHK